MDAVCPHCRRTGVSVWHLRWADRASPAVCRYCGGMAHPLASTASGIFAVTVLLLVLGGVGAAALASWWAAAAACAVAAAFHILAWRRAEPFPICLEAVQAARRARGLHGLLAVCVLLLKFLH